MCVRVNLSMPIKKQTQCSGSLTKQNKVNFYAAAQTIGEHGHVCLCLLLVVTLREREADFSCVANVFVCVWVCCPYEEKTIPLHTREKHNGGNKSG